MSKLCYGQYSDSANENDMKILELDHWVQAELSPEDICFLFQLLLLCYLDFHELQRGATHENFGLLFLLPLNYKLYNHIFRSSFKTLNL